MDFPKASHVALPDLHETDHCVILFGLSDMKNLSPMIVAPNHQTPATSYHIVYIRLVRSAKAACRCTSDNLGRVELSSMHVPCRASEAAALEFPAVPMFYPVSPHGEATNMCKCRSVCKDGSIVTEWLVGNWVNILAGISRA